MNLTEFNQRFMVIVATSSGYEIRSIREQLSNLGINRLRMHLIINQRLLLDQLEDGIEDANSGGLLPLVILGDDEDTQFGRRDLTRIMNRFPKGGIVMRFKYPYDTKVHRGWDNLVARNETQWKVGYFEPESFLDECEEYLLEMDTPREEHQLC